MERTEEQMKRTGGGESDGGRSAARKAGEQVDRLAKEARDKSREVLEERTQDAGAGLADAADAFESAADELESKEHTSIARFAREAAQRLSDAAERLREGDIDSMANEARDVARRNPALFLAGAAFAGFLSARFVKASNVDIEEFKAGLQGGDDGA
ncbi:hypothetical protein BH24PSE2_BH24PSE2_06870 [soil metagenome]